MNLIPPRFGDTGADIGFNWVSLVNAGNAAGFDPAQPVGIREIISVSCLSVSSELGTDILMNCSHEAAAIAGSLPPHQTVLSSCLQLNVVKTDTVKELLRFG
ncbi:MAG: hypothetical protein AAF635_14560 [Cyanobacteria bacterium P01_C01_bin.69]